MIIRHGRWTPVTRMFLCLCFYENSQFNSPEVNSSTKVWKLWQGIFPVSRQNFNWDILMMLFWCLLKRCHYLWPLKENTSLNLMFYSIFNVSSCLYFKCDYLSKSCCLLIMLFSKHRFCLQSCLVKILYVKL